MRFWPGVSSCGERAIGPADALPAHRGGRPKIRDLTDPHDARGCDAGIVRIEIWMDSADPPTGHVSEAGEALSFCGWIDLLAVLSRVVATRGHEEGQLGARPESQLGEDV